MASTRIIEQDHGTYTGHFTHHHNGYYAGDFRTTLLPGACPLQITEENLATAGETR